MQERYLCLFLVATETLFVVHYLFLLANGARKDGDPENWMSTGWFGGLGSSNFHFLGCLCAKIPETILRAEGRRSFPCSLCPINDQKRGLGLAVVLDVWRGGFGLWIEGLCSWKKSICLQICTMGGTFLHASSRGMPCYQLRKKAWI